MKARVIGLCALLALSLTCAAQDLYRWTDKDGKVHYSDQPPPNEVRKFDQPQLRQGMIDTSGLPYETQQAARNFPVTLYTAKDCIKECGAAREFLAARGIPFREQTLATAGDATAFKKEFGTDSLMIPALSVGSQKSLGFEAGAWGGMVDAAGYPRSAPRLGAAKPAPAPAPAAQ